MDLKINVDIDSLGNAYSTGTPEQLKELIKDVKSFVNEEEYLNEISKLDFDTENSKNFVYQGSYVEKTGNDYFRRISKSDVDIIFIVGKYTQNLDTVFENPEGNKEIEDWTEFIIDNLKEGLKWNNKNETSDYVEIYKFKKMKDIIFNVLKNKFSKKYEIENAEKVIKVYLHGEKSYSVELAIAGYLEMKFNKNTLTNNYKNKWEWKDLEKNNLIKIEDNCHVIKGYNIVTSERMINRKGEYYREIPNLSNWNKYRQSGANAKTNGNFSHYVQVFKNYRKIFDEKFPEQKIDVSSFHINSILINLFQLNATLFEQKISNKSCVDVAKFALDKINEYHYNNFVELNGIYKLKRNLNLEKFIAIEHLFNYFINEYEK
ncbi:hypothetical protein [Williamsoniiplasma luminosum]|uniref:cGAS/DncV-like nucleotidyltransferase C-terminal helical domain-containing protein n=1 Tax=Williamsoniiplasma luminosum TaxID=214888 RepID=A0A2S0NJ18_9MOLU|nr:hypothetical protein [Williamsoniiplasma luminosum]AVP49005.1 MAG: hypothetical protein C5T88_00160 [Williamsoniiplasma luminosum]